jgi:hypothetical protein
VGARGGHAKNVHAGLPFLLPFFSHVCFLHTFSNLALFSQTSRCVCIGSQQPQQEAAHPHHHHHHHHQINKADMIKDGGDTKGCTMSYEDSNKSFC